MFLQMGQDISAAYADQVEDNVFIVDDDPSFRSYLETALNRAGFKVVKFAAAEQFLAYVTPLHSGCVLTDMRMPGMDGLALQEELLRRNAAISLVVITGHADVSLAVKAMRRGALDILEKPFSNERLLEAVRAGLSVAKERAMHAALLAAISRKLDGLSERERDVLNEIMTGFSNKEIARHLKISPRTVEVHRSRIMEKMQAQSIAKLVQMVSLVL